MSTSSLDNSKLILWLVRSNRLIVLIVSGCLVLVVVFIVVLITIIISLILSIILVLIVSIFVDHFLPWLQEVFTILVLSLVDTFAINIKNPSNLTKDLLHLLVLLLLRRWTCLI